MTIDREQAWRLSTEELLGDLPKWRRDLILARLEDVEIASRHHAASAAYWHRQCTDLMAVERDRSKHIRRLEEQVRR